MTKSKFQIGTIILLAIIGAVGALFLINRRYQPAVIDVPKFDNKKTSTPSTSPDTVSQNPKSEIINLKSSILLPVPFTPQAPTANWDTLHNEACEEASAIMAAAYFLGLPSPSVGKDRERLINLPPEFTESEITKLTKWQDENFGYYLDTTSAETAQMIREIYGLNTKLVENFTAEAIKKELAQNHLVLISEYGRALGNPYYKSPGPIHHMLLIKGFDAKGNFITNDSGTKRGLNYPYTFDALYNSAADWSHETNNVDLNIKMMIVVWK